MTNKEKSCSFLQLYKAMNKCKSGVGWKTSVIKYCNKGLLNNLKLRDDVLLDWYKIGSYHNFVIHEPKRRDIVSTRFRDRIFQRSFCDSCLYDDVTKTFIYDNSACQIGEGNDFSRNRLKRHLQHYYRNHGSQGYVLKVDMKNYFGSTPHRVIKESLSRVISDEWELQVCFDVIDTYDKGDAIGVGLGSQITQLVQLLVLSELDHTLKEKAQARYYIRYMDDIVIISKDKSLLVHCLGIISSITHGLELNLNMKKTQIFKLSQGIKYLGFTFYITETGKVILTLDKENIKKRKRKIRKHHGLFLKGKMSFEKAEECYKSWKAHARKGNTCIVLNRMDKYFKDIWGEDYVQENKREGKSTKIAS